jgi:hypothetical protein
MRLLDFVAGVIVGVGAVEVYLIHKHFERIREQDQNRKKCKPSDSELLERDFYGGIGQTKKSEYSNIF